MERIIPDVRPETQPECGMLFEMLANLTDEDGALAELEDPEHLTDWLVDGREEENEIIPPINENLLESESRKRFGIK
jgi:hypothetical protein